MRTPLDDLGGEEALKRLVNRFYDLIETDPQGARIMSMHFQGHGLAHVREEQVNFLSGFLGGRKHYMEKHGHMNLRLLHDHVPITAGDAEDWLALMDRALADCGHGGAGVDRIRAALRRAATALVNRTTE
ncbi:MAG: cyanoglobin [Rhodobacterales bacterium 65-51]|uniref:globin domain-containing protein n=1 Tax=uncultured Gemmobacter sp. TaxID=1095917 RepID=UPI000961FF39|nr:cyanoglobin [uncultured Gemmobacter sp.]OJY28986.1 MAG: cyanoglobin [Rhodobacterales bacterium 65-51]